MTERVTAHYRSRDGSQHDVLVLPHTRRSLAHPRSRPTATDRHSKRSSATTTASPRPIALALDYAGEIQPYHDGQRAGHPLPRPRPTGRSRRGVPAAPHERVAVTLAGRHRRAG